MAAMTPNARFSPGLQTPTSESDPFNLNPSSSGTRRNRYSSFDTKLFSSYSPASPTQTKRQLEAHLVDTDRRIEDATKAGTALLDERSRLEARLRAVDTRQASPGLSNDFRQRSHDVGSSFNDNAPETPRQFIPKKPRNGYTVLEDGRDGDILSANGHSSPSKPSMASPRKARNGTSSHAQDIELATEISSSLLLQVRSLQNTLAEKDEALRRAEAEKERMSADAEIYALKLRSQEDNEQRIKDENWQLDMQNQQLMTEITEAATREQRLTHSVNNARTHQSAAEREYDDLRGTHDKLREEYEAMKRHMDNELTGMHRRLAAHDEESNALQRRVDELTSQNEELVQAAAYRLRMEQESNDTAAAIGSDMDNPEPITPDASPPGSPVKPTPRHGALESETLKSSLHHAHKMIQNLKNNIHREKTEKIELKRMLQDARDELEARRTDGGGAGAGANKKRATASQNVLKRQAGSSRLGGSKNPMEEVINDPSWEEYDDNSPTKPRTTRRRDMYDLTTDTSDAFETANEDEQMSTETEGFQTGFESIPGESEDELTETEELNTARSHQQNLARLVGYGRSKSFQSTASEEAGGFDSNMPLSNARGLQDYGTPTSRMMSGGNNKAHDSPASFVSVVEPNQRSHNLASELEDMGGDDSSVAASTPARWGGSNLSTPSTHVRDITPVQYTNHATTTTKTIETFDQGTMTEPWNPTTTATNNAGDTGISSQNEADGFETASAGASILQRIANVTGLSSLAPDTHTQETSRETFESTNNDESSTKEENTTTPVNRALNMSPITSQSIEPTKILARPSSTQGFMQQAPVPPSTVDMSGPASSLGPQRARSGTVNMPSTPSISSERAEDNGLLPRSLDSADVSTPDTQQTYRGYLEERSSPRSIQRAQSQAPSSRTPQSQNDISTQSTPSSMAFVDNLIKRPQSTPVGGNAPRTPPNFSPPARGVTPVGRVSFAVPSIPSFPPSDDNSQLQNGVQNRSKPDGVAEYNDQIDKRGPSPGLPGFSERFVISPRNPPQPSQVPSRQPTPQSVYPPVDRQSSTVPGLPPHALNFNPPVVQPDTRPPFRAVSGNAPLGRQPSTEMMNETADAALIEKREGKRKASDQEGLVDNSVLNVPRRAITPILSTSSTPSRNSRSGSLTARFSPNPATYIEPEQFISMNVQSGGLNTSMPNQPQGAGGMAPSLPSGYRQAIASASRTTTPVSSAAGMGPPQMPPPSSWRRTASNAGGSTDNVAMNVPVSRTVSQGPAESHRSSMSSYDGERASAYRVKRTSEDLAMQNTDPRMIQAITQTMIGEFLWKYTRKAGRDEHSAKRHRRFFWIHPYTRTLYWSNQDPTNAGKTELKAKSVSIEAVRVVSDDSHNPPGLHSKSIIVVTPGRSIKFTAPTAQRHETWFNALSYLLLRTPYNDPRSAAATLSQDARNGSNSNLVIGGTASSRPTHKRTDTEDSVNSDDIAEFNPGSRSRSINASSRSQSTNRNTTSSKRTPSTVSSRADLPPALQPESKSPAELHPAMRSAPSKAPSDTAQPAQVDAATPSPNVSSNAPKEAISGSEQATATTATTSDGFKKPQVPPSPRPQSESSRRGRLGSMSDRFSFFGRGRSKSRGREEAGIAIVTDSPEKNKGSMPPPAIAGPAPIQSSNEAAQHTHTHTHTHDHNHNHTDGDGPGLENVRACCDGKHDVSSLSHRSNSMTANSAKRHSSRDRSRAGGIMGPHTPGDASSWRRKFSDAGSVGSKTVGVPSLTRDVR